MYLLHSGGQSTVLPADSSRNNGINNKSRSFHHGYGGDGNKENSGTDHDNNDDYNNLTDSIGIRTICCA
jgi:hypothetical protein